MANGPRLASRTVSSRRTARVAEKLQQKIRDKDYYEAHQTYRVLYQRYKAQGKETEALDLLYDGALLLIQHGQVRVYQTLTNNCEKSCLDWTISIVGKFPNDHEVPAVM